MEFTREKAGPNHESIGTTKLYVNDKVVAEGPMRTQVGKFTLSGDGLCVGFDSGDAVSAHYKSPGEFKGGTIQFVGRDHREGAVSRSRDAGQGGDGGRLAPCSLHLHRPAVP